jgi:hypothetical protein
VGGHIALHQSVASGADLAVFWLAITSPPPP